MHARPRDLVEPVQLHEARVEVRPQRLLEAFALAADVEGRQSAGRRDHAEHAQRRREREGRGEYGAGTCRTSGSLRQR